MQKLKKVLIEKGIVYEADEIKAMYYGAEYDTSEYLVGIEGNFIITVWYSAVLDPELRIYDRYTFKLVAVQNMYPDDMSFGTRYNRWVSAFPIEEDDWYEESDSEFLAGMSWDDIYGI